MKFKFCGGLDVPEWLLTEFAVLSKLSCVRVLLLSREVASDLTGGTIDNKKLLKLTHGVVERSSVKAIVASLRYVLSNAAKYEIASQELVPELSQLGLPSENCSAIAKPYEANREKIAGEFWEVLCLVLWSSGVERAAPSRPSRVLCATTTVEVNLPRSHSLFSLLLSFSSSLPLLPFPPSVSDPPAPPTPRPPGPAAKLRETSLRLPGISSVDWRAECILGSSLRTDFVAPAVQLRLNLSAGGGSGGGGGDFGSPASNFCFELDDATFSLFRSEMRSALSLLERA